MLSSNVRRVRLVCTHAKRSPKCNNCGLLQQTNGQGPNSRLAEPEVDTFQYPPVENILKAPPKDPVGLWGRATASFLIENINAEPETLGEISLSGKCLTLESWFLMWDLAVLGGVATDWPCFVLAPQPSWQEDFSPRGGRSSRRRGRAKPACALRHAPLDHSPPRRRSPFRAFWPRPGARAATPPLALSPRRRGRWAATRGASTI
mmetsp:Transcript_26353/g.69633  ORF Transcript_26353/g.69633 Transcript_26353/m.69633 type:complete len:205 (+) Transcript_26353:387-1001(+)